jgi:thymidylate synthase
MIPVLNVCGTNIPETWEKSLEALYTQGIDIPTQYDKVGDIPSKDATMILTITEPLSEPMIHLDMPGGFEDLQEYVMEVCDGIKDHWIRDPNDPNDKRWEYTYHQRLFNYNNSINQIKNIIEQLKYTPHTRRAQCVTWNVKTDSYCYDPPCAQSLWLRIINNKLCMNVRFRSNDAYKAAFMNIFALVQLQKRIADELNVSVGRYCHIADSYHIYGKDIPEFENRFLNALKTRPFEQRTVRYENVKDIMDESIPIILDKVKKQC